MRALLFLTFIFLSACDSDNPSASAKQEPAETRITPKSPDHAPEIVIEKPREPLGSFDYEFWGKNEKGESCSTGVRRFPTLRKMCVNIQDPAQNLECAFNQRLNKFIRDCEPQGFTFHESLQCRVLLLDKSAEPDIFGQVDKGLVIKSRDYCIGFDPEGTLLAGSYFIGEFHKAVKIELDMSFISAKETTTEERSYIRIALSSTEERDQIIHETNAVEYDGGIKIQSGRLSENFQYLIECGRTWACVQKPENQSSTSGPIPTF